jgi:GH35 family endo-1,4-beta-xylanase
VFTNADAQVSFAKANGMHVRGHTLVWHNQTPAWVFLDANNQPMTATPANQALLTQRMQNHIQQVMTHFGNDVPIWDVVNEAIDPSQPDGYRRSPWFNVLGKQFIDIAFQAARAANPTAKLYINDFDTTNPPKRDALLAVVRDLKSRGIPIDGVGHQMHNNIEYPPVQTIIDSINMFDTTGVEQSVTELDYSIYSGSPQFSTPFTSYTDIPASRHTLVGYSFRNFLQAIESTGKIVSVTIWGTSDDKSWLTSSTKVDAPLLFDTSLQKKPAYWAFVDPLQLAGADLSSSMTAAAMSVPAGQAVAYTITVNNNADVNQPSFAPTDDDLPATNVSLTTAVPAHTTFQSLTVPAGWNCTTPAVGGTGPITCTMPSLAAGGTAAFALTVSVADCSAANGSAITASANVTSATADPNPAPNNASSATIQVSNAAPVITANGPLDATAECATSYTDQGATATDSCEGAVAVGTTSTVDIGHVGNYSVTYTAADQAGNQASPVVRSVHVADTTVPVVTVTGPSPIMLECATAFIDMGATAADSCVGALSVSTSGTVNAGAPGSYTLGYSATDPSGNTGTASRVVNVSDTIAPVVMVLGANPATVECGTAFADPGAAAADSCAGALPVMTSGAVNTGAPGSYTLGYAATDPSGNTGAASRVVTVRDTTAPTITVVAPITMDPPNHKYHAFAMADLVSAVTDGCGAGVGIASVVITKVTSDEPDNSCGDGDTLHDIVIGSDCRSVQLRSERQGGGNGRVYTIYLHVVDAAGNRSNATVKAMVPANGSGKHPAVDDGPHQTVTSSCQ